MPIVFKRRLQEQWETEGDPLKMQQPAPATSFKEKDKRRTVYSTDALGIGKEDLPSTTGTRNTGPSQW
jgi:hypothetical protein